MINKKNRSDKGSDLKSNTYHVPIYIPQAQANDTRCTLPPLQTLYVVSHTLWLQIYDLSVSYDLLNHTEADHDVSSS